MARISRNDALTAYNEHVAKLNHNGEVFTVVVMTRPPLKHIVHVETFSSRPADARELLNGWPSGHALYVYVGNVNGGDSLLVDSAVKPEYGPCMACGRPDPDGSCRCYV